MRKLLLQTILGLLLLGFQGVAAQSQPYGDYTLYSVQNGTTANLVDLTGANYHTWTFASGDKTGYSSYLLPNRVLLRSVMNTGNTFQGGGITGRVQKVDWNGNVIWNYPYSTSTYCMHHDICPMPNGNVLLISYEAKTAAEATAAGASQNITVWSEKIVEIQPVGASGGNVVWEWHLWDHLVQSVDPNKANYYASVSAHPELMNINYNLQKDWFHMNGIDYNEELDQIIFSSHNMNQLFIIDHSTTTAEAASHAGGNAGKGGDFLYRWGNPASYGMTGTTNFNVVHDGHFVPKDCPRAGAIAGYNNNGISNTKSSVDIIMPPRNGYNYNWTPGSAYAPSTYTYRHACNGHNNNMGNSQQLPNGNMLVCIAQSGFIYEVDSLNNVVWSKTASGTVPQAFRYTACYVNGTEATVTAAASLPTICAGDSVQLTATPVGGTTYTYNWTSDVGGFTSTAQNPMAAPTTTTTYYLDMMSGSCPAKDTVTVAVNPAPTAIATNNGTDISASTGNAYQWYLNGNVINGATTQTYMPTQSGTYSVLITGANGCTAMSNDVVFVIEGIDVALANSFNVYPNPSTGIVNIAINSNVINDYAVSVSDAYGNVITAAKNNKQLDLSSLANGIYYLTFTAAQKEGRVVKMISVLK